MANELKNRGVILRGLVLIAMLTASVLPGLAMRHLTVAQLEKMLTSDVAKHHSDDDMRREFGSFDLTERLTDATRNRISTSLNLGPQTTLALQLMADESAVLDPPASELPTTPPPDAAASAL